jgi:hypothetical protein
LIIHPPKARRATGKHLQFLARFCVFQNGDEAKRVSLYQPTERFLIEELDDPARVAPTHAKFTLTAARRVLRYRKNAH